MKEVKTSRRKKMSDLKALLAKKEVEMYLIPTLSLMKVGSEPVKVRKNELLGSRIFTLSIPSPK